MLKSQKIKKKNKKLTEEAAERLADIFIKQIEYEKKKKKEYNLSKNG